MAGLSATSEKAKEGPAMRVALIQMNSRTAARDENVARACAFVDEAAGRGAEVAILPEFFNVEYFPQYRDYR